MVGTNGTGSLTVDGGFVRALEVLQVGQVGGGGGRVEMLNNALVATDGTYIAPNGAIIGSGTLAVDSLGLLVDGTLSPGVKVLFPKSPAASPQSPAQAGAATLSVSGTLAMGPTGRLEIPITGNSPGQYGSLAVTGAANLDGVLKLIFIQGYAPKLGDTFTFLSAAGGLNGEFDSVEIDGLAPGFEYDLTIANGQVTLEALNDGAPLESDSQSLWVVR
jgi:hypothetical protein